jgi:hypothetical protein
MLQKLTESSTERNPKFWNTVIRYSKTRRAVGRSENMGGEYLVSWWAYSATLVGRGLSDLSKSEGAIVPLAPLPPTGLKSQRAWSTRRNLV